MTKWKNQANNKDIMKKYIKKIFKYLLILSIIGVLFIIAFLIGLRLFFHTEEVIVPDFTNMQFHLAQKEAQEIGCTLYISNLTHSTVYDAGVVVSQRLRPGSAIAKNRSIPVNVSLGPERAHLIDYSGQLYYDAVQNLRMRGFQIGNITEVYSSVFLPNQVIAQHPSPGVDVYQNIPVNLLISRGRKKRRFMLPDLIGKEFFEVQYILDSMNLFIDEILYRETRGFPEDIVVNQRPISGTMVHEGDYVSITLNKKGIRDYVRKKYIFEIVPLPPGAVDHKISLYDKKNDRMELIWDMKVSPEKYHPVIISGYTGDTYSLYINDQFYKNYTIR